MYIIVARPAIAMIELIFAIVIMGIVLMSAPELVSQSAKSNLTTFQQESIAMAASHANALMSYPWDENNVPNATTSNFLTVANGAVALDQVGVERGATRNPSQRSRAFGAMAATAIAQEGAPFNDVDDFNGIARSLTIYGGAGAGINSTPTGEYIDTNITIATAVSYANDASAYGVGVASFTFNFPAVAGVGTTNIKRITTTLTSGRTAGTVMSDKRIVLQAFMCNIGASVPDRTTDN